MEKHYSADELAEMTGKTTRALAQMRYLGTGPRFVKFGRTVLYPASAVKEFFDAHTKTQTGTAA